jgi:hypothetical protein
MLFLAFRSFRRATAVASAFAALGALPGGMGESLVVTMP